MRLQKIKEFIVDKFCCKFSIPYYMLMLLRSRWLHSLYNSKNKINIIDYEQRIKEFLEKNNNSNIYICLKWAAGDIALYFLIVSNVISCMNNTQIHIICDKKYIDILNIYKTKYNFIKTIWLDKNLIISREENIKKAINIREDSWFLDLRWIIENNQKAFFVNHGRNNYLSYYELGRQFKNVKKTAISKLEYLYNNIDETKLRNILEYCNKWNLILCNFENNSYKLARKDSIEFSDYISKISEIGRKQNLRFVVNSVYNNEKLYKDDNILITRLNFQEIIWLAEHNKIKLFISERNGLNDVFKVFYPTINQIIYYPDYYYSCCDKNIYHLMYKEHLKLNNVMDFWHLPWENIVENIRWNYIKTVEKYVMRLNK